MSFSFKPVLIIAVVLIFSLSGMLFNQPSEVEAVSKVNQNEKLWVYPVPEYENFTVVVLPDTQYYPLSFPDIFENQTQWIVDNVKKMNIVFVTHLGDIVDYSSLEQWENANRSISKLDGKVPWALLPGNHDFIDLASYNKYFGYERFAHKSWYGGAFQNVNTNSYQLFSAGGGDYLFFHLQYIPDNDTLAWASGVIDSYPNMKVIISTHSYIATNSTRRSNTGERIWSNLVSPHADQVFLVLCGHNFEESKRIDVVDGNVVYQLLSDYQFRSTGGEGWLRTLEFCPSQNKIFVKTFSPYFNKFETDENSEFVLDYDLEAPQTNITVLSNSTLSGFSFSQSMARIGFIVSGDTRTVGYCNVSIPQNLLEGNQWIVTVNGENRNHTALSDTQHNNLYFTYTHSGNLEITIIARSVIPEFPSILALGLLLFATAILFAILIKVAPIPYGFKSSEEKK